MNNKMIDLNNHLFAELERLGDESVKGDKLKEECERAKAIGLISENIIRGAAIALKAEEFKQEYRTNTVPAMLENKKG